MQINYFGFKAGTNSLQQQKVCDICSHYHISLRFSHVNPWEVDSCLGNSKHMVNKTSMENWETDVLVKER